MMLGKWMFDPDYRPDEPLSPEDAIRAMLDGERLADHDGVGYWYSGCGRFSSDSAWGAQFVAGLRRPEKRKRKWTRWEVLAWASSEESHGWVVRQEGDSVWKAPQYFAYTLEEDRYQRARLLPDLSGVDPNTIQGFEVEE
jgi:hypothetical protein